MFSVYEYFFNQPNQDMDSWLSNRDQVHPFDKTTFLSDQPRPHLRFMSCFLESQMFANFIDAKVLAYYGQYSHSVRVLDAPLEWISKNGEVVVRVSPLRTIRGIPSHLTCCKTKKQFVYGLLKGIGANLHSQSLIQFGQMILSMCGEKAPDMKNPFLCRYDSKLDALITLDSYVLDSTHWNNDEQHSLVPTTDLLINYKMIQPWFDNKEHVLVVVPEACGKSLLVKHCLRQMRSTRIVIFHCKLQLLRRTFFINCFRYKIGYVSVVFVRLTRTNCWTTINHHWLATCNSHRPNDAVWVYRCPSACRRVPARIVRPCRVP
ncbi:cytoplasmic dynein 2 heavy chain 1-like [Daphnia pulex]|uniref:cytoplasmic dynein 2 heavy chain 1-like n=1 Tax=Daphnia pulex TaxID=6669 RepID=UPI001EE0AD24|nr:cytoplasmic dynein 2 heavy chain 1-like [Daphnia pulex]